MEKRNKMKIGCIVFLVIGIFSIIAIIVCINRDLSGLQEGYSSFDHSTFVRFKDIKQTIFITTRKWGLGGQHSQTVISNVDHANNDIFIDREKEIVLDEICGFYYKTLEPDSLLVFFSSGSYSEEEIIYRQLDGIKVKITKYKATMDKYYKNYQNLGLSQINCSDKME
jgi:hypothetical protein